MTSTARLWYLRVGDVEAEHHAIPLCICSAVLLRNALENLALLRQMQRIRGYYRSLVPEADQFFGPAAEEERFSAAMATVGCGPGRRGCCSPGPA